MPGSSNVYPTNIAHDRTKVSEAGRKDGRTTITTVDRSPSKAGSDVSLNIHGWF
nr:stress protein [Pseudomonas sp. MPBD7-1]